MKEEDRRPDSEQLLRSIQNADGPPGGRLKIFFGYAAGVGKTYAMLEAAHRAKEAGVDVVAGYIEPHTRPETMALLEGLEVLPTKTVTYKGISLKEFDLDGALARHPQLLLVDELAHTNAAGCRHRKRYQDVEELLRAGIDPSRVDVHPDCTKCHPERYWSHRAMGDQRGGMAAMICLTEDTL